MYIFNDEVNPPELTDPTPPEIEDFSRYLQNFNVMSAPRIEDPIRPTRVEEEPPTLESDLPSTEEIDEELFSSENFLASLLDLDQREEREDDEENFQRNLAALEVDSLEDFASALGLSEEQTRAYVAGLSPEEIENLRQGATPPEDDTDDTDLVRSSSPEYDPSGDISDHLDKRSKVEGLSEEGKKVVSKSLKQKWKEVPSADDVDDPTIISRFSDELSPDDYDASNLSKGEIKNIQSMYAVGQNEVKGYSILQNIGIDTMLKDFIITESNLFDILKSLGADRPEDILNGNTVDVAFNINGSFNINSLIPVEGLTEDELKAKVITASKHAMMEHLSNIPDGTIVSNVPNEADGQGKGRSKVYERVGFGKFNGFSMLALKHNGKLYPIQPDVPIEAGGFFSEYFEGLYEYVEEPLGVEINEDLLSDPEIWEEYFSLK